MINMESRNISMVILPLHNENDAELIDWIRSRMKDAEEAGSSFPAYDASAALIQILKEQICKN